MNLKLSLVLGLLVMGLFPALALYGVQGPPLGLTKEKAVEIALSFVKNCPTFRFDGFPESVKVIGVSELEGHPVQYDVTIGFTCRGAGYGDRTGRMVLTVITPHVIVVRVKGARVTSAVIDGRWDEIRQVEIASQKYQTSEFARDAAIGYILGSHTDLGSVPIPSRWTTTNLTPRLIGAVNVLFTGDGWAVNTSYPVVPDPVIRLEIKYTGKISFAWTGKAGQTGNITEISFNLTSLT